MLEDPILNGQHSYQDRVFQHDEKSHSYYLLGIADGVALEDPYEILSASGEKLANNVISYNAVYLDQKQKLRMISIPVVVKLPDDTLIVSESITRAVIQENYGDDFTSEEVKQFINETLRNKLESQLGKVVAMRFYIDSESVDYAIQNQASLGNPVIPGSIRSTQWELIRQYVKGREDDLKKLVETGETDLKYLYISANSTDFYYPQEPDIVKLENIDLKSLIDK
jgi:hypothetical protein